MMEKWHGDELNEVACVGFNYTISLMFVSWIWNLDSVSMSLTLLYISCNMVRKSIVLLCF